MNDQFNRHMQNKEAWPSGVALVTSPHGTLHHTERVYVSLSATWCNRNEIYSQTDKTNKTQNKEIRNERHLAHKATLGRTVNRSVNERQFRSCDWLVVYSLLNAACLVENVACCITKQSKTLLAHDGLVSTSSTTFHSGYYTYVTVTTDNSLVITVVWEQ